MLRAFGASRYNVGYSNSRDVLGRYGALLALRAVGVLDLSMWGGAAPVEL